MIVEKVRRLVCPKCFKTCEFAFEERDSRFWEDPPVLKRLSPGFTFTSDGTSAKPVITCEACRVQIN